AGRSRGFRSARAVEPYTSTTTSTCPSAIAAMACSTMNSQVLPPTPVPSTHVGRRPRYSATSTGISSPVPLDANPSTSPFSSPASTRARLAAWWWSSKDDLSSTRPQSDNAAPTIATRRPIPGLSRTPVDAGARLEELLPFGDGVLVRPQPDVRVPESDGLSVPELARAPDRPHRALDRQGRLRRDGVGRPRRPLVQLLLGRDLRDEADLVRALCGQALVVAQQREAHDLAEGHDPRHVDGLERRRHPVRHVWVEEGGVLGGDDELDLAQHVEGAAARDAVDGRDHGLPQVGALGTDVVAGIVEHERRAAGSDPVGIGRVAATATHLLHAVDAGAERLLARPGQDDATHVVMAPEAAPQRVELALHERVERVEAVRPVERDPGDAVTLLVE